jgi:hypothetical protein
MKKILDIYKEYRIMPQLAVHQLRVAAVAVQLCDSISIKVDKDSVVKACLLHDMGNIIKFQLEKFPEWNDPEGTDYWQNVKNEYINKYGKDEHKASINIAKELGISSYIVELINSIDASVAEKIVTEPNFEKKICAYVDNRVSPHGVVSAEEHSMDAKERYKNHPHAFQEEDRLYFMKNLYLIEKQIFSNSNIKPEDINDESVKEIIENLKSFAI